MTSMETLPSAANKVAKNEHITSLLWILPELYLLFLHKPATFSLTHPWQSNRCSTSAQTRPHDLSTFHSLPIPQHATIAHTPLFGQASTSPGIPPTPKTYQPDAENILNTITADVDSNLQCHERRKLGRVHKPSSPNTPFIHGDEVIGELYQKKWPLSLSPLTPVHGLAQCYRHSLPPPTIPTKNTGTPHTLKTNITDPMPISCTNVPPNHHAHSGSSYPPTSDGCNLHHQHDGRFLATPTLYPHQIYILSNSLNSAYLRHTAHYYVMLPIHSNFIPQPLYGASLGGSKTLKCDSLRVFRFPIL